MAYRTIRNLFVASVMAVSVLTNASAAAEPQTSPRMEKAKDYIAEEQWLRAIELLKVAAVDRREKHQDEALFWLAHSQNQAGDLSEAVATIADLERRFPASRWVKPARSIRVELAQKLRREDILWWTATAAPAPPPPAGSAPPGRPANVSPVPRPQTPRAARPSQTVVRVPPPPPETGGAPATVTAIAPGARAPRTSQAAAAGGRRPVTSSMPTIWVSEHSVADTDLRIQALGSLMKTDAARVIPILRSIALESTNPGEASRAVFVLAQSGKPEAHSTVLEVAKRASEAVSVAAVRELGRFGGRGVSDELLQVYEVGKPRVKYQVVNSLGERAAANALLRIVQSESDAHLRNLAIVTLGRAGGREQLHRLYRRATPDAKRPIITGLFNARAEDELIEIAKRETDSAIRREVHARLRLLGTPKAKDYLEKIGGNR